MERHDLLSLMMELHLPGMRAVIDEVQDGFHPASSLRFVQPGPCEAILTIPPPQTFE
jgi:hypothetical protein